MTIQNLVDIGINLTDTAFAADCIEVVAQARTAGVSTLIVTGTDLNHSRQALELCRRLGPGLYCTAGVHPHYASRWDEQHHAALTTLARQPEVVAIGETGLDYNRNLSPPEDQHRAFTAQLELAVEEDNS